MLNNKINVVLWDQPVGKLYWDDINMDINIYDSDIDLRPGIDINGHCFSTNGVFINIPSPTIKVTGIRQTRAE